jgi:hypothetical protein
MKQVWAGVLMVVMGAGCEGIGNEIEPAPGDVSMGKLAVTVVPFSGTDVVAIRVKIVAGSADCRAMALQQKTGAIRPDVTLAPNHPVTDAFFVLPEGMFRACLTPLSDTRGTPSALCGPADGVAMVMAGATTEVSIVSQCKGDPRGGLDVLASLNRPPLINALDLLPSKLALVNHDVEIRVDATDPDRDFDITFTFTQVSGPAMGTLSVMGSRAIFRASAPGTYEIRVVVSDGRGGQTALTFPILLAG